MTFDEQMAANAAIARLVSPDGETFAATDAMAVRNVLEPQRDRIFQMNITVPRWRMFPGFRALTTQGQNANSSDDDEKQATARINQPTKIWIGSFAVWLARPSIAGEGDFALRIEDRFCETSEARLERQWLIAFRGDDPWMMFTAKVRSLSLGFLMVRWISFVKWKHPQK
jgi:hypothetical protein